MSAVFDRGLDADWLGTCQCHNPNCGDNPQHMQLLCRTEWPDYICQKCSSVTAIMFLGDAPGHYLCEKCYYLKNYGCAVCGKHGVTWTDDPSEIIAEEQKLSEMESALRDGKVKGFNLCDEHTTRIYKCSRDVECDMPADSVYNCLGFFTKPRCHRHHPDANDSDYVYKGLSMNGEKCTAQFRCEKPGKAYYSWLGDAWFNCEEHATTIPRCWCGEMAEGALEEHKAPLHSCGKYYDPAFYAEQDIDPKTGKSPHDHDARIKQT